MKTTVLIAASVSVLLASPAAAQVSHSSRSSFTAAAGPVTTVDFEGCDNVGLASDQSITSAGPCTGVPGGVTFSPPNGYDLYIASPGQSANPTVALGLNFPTGGAISIALDAFSTSFGADLFQNFGGGFQSGAPASFVVGFYNGASLVNSYNINVASGTGSFFGLTGSSPFDAVRVSQAGGYAVIDNVSFGSGGPAVPEPATWAMMLLGFGMVGVGLRRRAGKVTTKIAYA